MTTTKGSHEAVNMLFKLEQLWSIQAAKLHQHKICLGIDFFFVAAYGRSFNCSHHLNVLCLSFVASLNLHFPFSPPTFIPLFYSSHITSFDSFPRLDPPPPSGKKRLPRALKTTQDMMISSDPVVSSPDPVDSSSFPSSPEKTSPITQEEIRNEEEQQQGKEEEKRSSGPAERKPGADSETAEINDNVDTVIGGEEDGVEVGSSDEGMDEHGLQLQLSVPDLINKDPPLESKAKQCDIWQKAPGPDSRLASTPCSGKTPCRISLGEDVLLGNGAPCSKATGGSTEDMEHHPDLLSFE